MIEGAQLTLIITTLTPRFAHIACDMRISSKADGVHTDLAGKLGYIRAIDGSALYAFTGIATKGHHNTRVWIQQALQDAASFSLNETIYRFADIATKKFANLMFRGERLTVVFCGYSVDIGGFFGTVSNFEDEAGLPYPTVREKFAVRLNMSKRFAAPISGVMINGYNQSKFPSELQEINKLVISLAPRDAITAKSVDVIRELVNTNKTGGTVSQNVMTSALEFPPIGQFGIPQPITRFVNHDNVPSYHLIDMVDLTPQSRISIGGIELIVHDDGGIPANIGANQHCPCGSTHRFKYCCGRGK